MEDGEDPTHQGHRQRTDEATVVMACHDRGPAVLESVRSVLDEGELGLRLIVVDGSSDGTTELLEAITDDRLTVIRQPNLGMPVARNVGLEFVTTPWVAFLDDDDCLRGGWARRMLGAAATDQDADIVVCGHRRVGPDGTVLAEVEPRHDGLDQGTLVAGTFLVRTELMRQVGGMLEGLPFAHHWDLAVRLSAALRSSGRRFIVVDAALVDIEVRPSAERSLSTPRQAYDGLRWVLARHASHLAGQRQVRARFRANVGVAACRVGQRRRAQRWFAAAVADDPSHLAHWVRLAVSLSRWASRKSWGDERDFAPAAASVVGGLHGVVAVTFARGSAPDTIFLPAGYRERPQPSAGESTTVVGSGDPFADVRPDADRRAKRLARRGREPIVLAGELGIVKDPHARLAEVVVELGADRWLVIGEMRRSAVDNDLLGPPADPAIRRRWEPAELVLLLEAHGLEVVSGAQETPRRWRREGAAMVMVARPLAGR